MKINEKNLIVFASTPPYDMDGHLSKKGEVNKAFQRRYFVLKGNLLFYFEKRGDKEPLGLIIVEGCTIELSDEVDKYCFEIAFNGNRTYVLAAETQESMESWMKALTCAGYEYKRIIVAELQRQLEEIEDSRNKICGGHNKTIHINAVPKPPPRRHNPFNRPAPPPPNAALHEVGVYASGAASPMPFINGYFGLSNARTQIDQHISKPENVNGNASSTPKPIRRPGPGRSEFFVNHPAAAAISRPTVLPCANKINEDGPAQLERCSKAIEEFTQNHERFGQDVMRDVNEYRARNQPLIKF